MSGVSDDRYLIGYNGNGKRWVVGSRNLETAVNSAYCKRLLYTGVSITRISIWPHRTLESSLGEIVGWDYSRPPRGFGIHKSILALSGIR